MKYTCLIWGLLAVAWAGQVQSASVSQHTVVHDDSSHAVHLAYWKTPQSENKPTVVLLSGPIDSWHSDTAWFSNMGPLLAATHNVIAIDRAGLVLAQEDAPVGYQHFATDLAIVLKDLSVKNATVVAFASSNITLQYYFANHPNQTALSRAVLIDPDALTEYSSARYSNDAKPFKDNAKAYQDYVAEGKYTPRVEQKNAADKAQVEALAKQSGEILTMDWRYLESLFKARLAIPNQLNLFREIARYDEDLAGVMALSWPKNIPTYIADTAFEQAYIDTSDDPEQKKELQTWQQDAADYYQRLAELNPKNRYIPISSHAHLYQMEAPKTVIGWINELESTP